MGYNAAAIVLMDGINHIGADTEFGQKLRSAALAANSRIKSYDVSAGSFANPMTILPAAHADLAQVVLIHGNSIERLHVGVSPDPLTLVKEMAEKLGYTLRKKRA